jgi:hypothetical protein
MNDRLTDEKWREMLLQTPAPEPPSWTASFIVSGNKPEGFHPDFYMWEKPNSSTITVDIKPEEPRIGDNITVTMSTNEWAPGDPPIVRYTLPQSQDSRQVENLIVENPNAGPWIATIPTTGMNPGKLYIDIAKAFFPDTLKYRASVEVLRGTDVGENEQSGPVSFTLYQNRPNPFNATTAIGFDLSEQNRLQLDIFDINGRFVRRLLTGTFGAGSHTVLWDGTDEVGGVKSSGVYYYRLLTEGHMDVKRMLLLK